MRGRAAPCSASAARRTSISKVAKSGYGYFATFGRDCLDRGKVAVRGNRESGFDDIDSERLEFLRQVHLLLEVHGTARRLLAVAQRRVEDSYPLPCHHTPPSNPVWKEEILSVSPPKVKVIIFMIR